MCYVSIGLLFEFSYYVGSSNFPFLQNWGNYTYMSLAVIIYVTYASDVLLICWFGTQLTQHVRKNVLLLYLLLAFVTQYDHNVNWATNQLRNYVPLWVLKFYCSTLRSELNFLGRNLKLCFKVYDNVLVVYHPKY